MTQINALLLFVPLWCPQLALFRLAPLPAINRSRSWVSYRLTDGWVLIAYLAAANSMALSAYEGLRDRSFVQPLTIFANLLVIALWLKCQRFMHYHAIQRSAARLLFQAFVYPLSVLAVSGIVTAGLFTAGNVGALVGGSDVYLAQPHAMAGATALMISILLLFVVRLVFRRFVLPHSQTTGSWSAGSN